MEAILDQPEPQLRKPAMPAAVQIITVSMLKPPVLLERNSRSHLVVRVMIFLVAASVVSHRRAISDDAVRWNQIQVIGTHNSYHLAPSPREVADCGGRRTPSRGARLFASSAGRSIH